MLAVTLTLERLLKIRDALKAREAWLKAKGVLIFRPKATRTAPASPKRSR